MQQINNGFNAYYYLTEEGIVYNSCTKEYIKADVRRNFILETTEGNKRKISLKKLFRLVFNYDYVIDNIEDLEEEQWKPIERTNNRYWISDKGRVKSYCYYEAIILKPDIINGYERVTIMQEGSKCSKLISRLVAAAFLMPPASMDMQLHHKNNCRIDNRKENLVWLTPAQHREEHRKMKLQKENKENATEGN